MPRNLSDDYLFLDTAAMSAVTGLIKAHPDYSSEDLAAEAYDIADSMLAVRESVRIGHKARVEIEERLDDT